MKVHEETRLSVERTRKRLGRLPPYSERAVQLRGELIEQVRRLIDFETDRPRRRRNRGR